MTGHNGLGLRRCVQTFLLISLFAFCATVRGISTEAELEKMAISAVEVRGARTMTEAQIMSAVRSRAGETFSTKEAAEDAKRIGRLKGVEYAYYNTETTTEGKVKLTFVVAEKNVIKSITFSGNKKFKAKTLAGKLDFKKDDYISKYLVEAGKESLIDFYHTKGFAFAKVTLNEQGLADGVVNYQIEEGSRVKVKKVRFAGNRVFKASELKKVLKTKTKKFLLFQGYYEQSVVSADVVKLQKVYQKRGYLDAQIRERLEFGPDNKKVTVVYDIAEGPIYTVEKVIIVGNKYFDNIKLADGLKLKEGLFYSQEKADADTKAILKRYREVGFVDAEVKSFRKFSSENKVDTELEVTEGGRFRIGQVNITGNTDTQDKVVRRVLDESDFKPGQWYNADLARGDGSGELEKNLQRSLMAESTFIKPAGKKPDVKDAHVDVTEGQTGMVMLGAGVDSSSGLLGQFIFEQRNFDIRDWPDSMHEFITGKSFKGAGQIFRISLEPGTEYSQYSVSFTEPYLNDKPVSLDVMGSKYMRERESYDEDRTKGYTALEKRYPNKWRVGIGFRLENVNVESIEDDAPQEIKDVAGDNLLAGVKFMVTKDVTDNRFNPSKGSIFDASYEQVTGDEIFGILSSTMRWYKTLYEDLAERKTVLETKVRGATTVGDAPPFEKFYAGGIGSLRGFEYRGVSTRGLSTGTIIEKKDPIGSDWMVLAGSELAIPLGSDTFAGLFFVDSGIIDTGGVRAAAGTGIQILIPQWFGPVPMRFEFAIPISKSEDDETQVFSFSVGRLF